MRRSTTLQDKYAQIARELGVASEAPDLDAELDDDIGDDLLSLVFTCCHPVLSTEARVALTLRMLGGLTTPEIARAFLVPERDASASGSRARSARSPRRACRSRCRPGTSCSRASRRCSRSST